MFEELLTAIDDFLIDRACQPFCNWLQKNFGWSKRVPIAISVIAMIIGITPLVSRMLFSKYWILMPFASILCIFILVNAQYAYSLIREEIHQKKNASQRESALDSTRVRFSQPRKINLVAFIIALPSFLIGMNYPEISLLSWGCLIGNIGILASVYFRACTNLPRGKTMFQKIKSWLSTFAVRPQSAT